MKRRVLVFAVLAAAFAGTASAQSDDPSAAPPGLQPANVTLSRLLQQNRAAVGSVTGDVKSTNETWTYRRGGLSGTQTYIALGTDFREDTVLGPFQSARGSYGGTRWQQNPNGITREMTDLHERDDVDRKALRHALESGSGVTLLGQVRSPAPAYVVRVDPAAGRMEYLYYDAKSYLIVREDSVVEHRRETTTYDSFRSTGGQVRPWHIHQSNGLEHDDADWTLQSLRYGDPIDRSKLAIPASENRIVTLSGSPVWLPATISGDRVILTAQMGPHKVNFQLDSGASGILLDRGVADALSIKSYGEKTEITAGQYSAADAIVPRIDLGSAVLHGVAAETAPFSMRSYDGTAVAGLIGYDFIQSCVLHIDYAHGTVDAYDPLKFGPPPGAVTLPIRLDDGVPVISARIGSTLAQHFIVDTGADRSMLFSSFAAAHAADVPGQGAGEAVEDTLPVVAAFSGVGGEFKGYATQVGVLGLSSIALPNWRFEVSQDAPSFEGEDYDGLIGQDVLRNFDVYLDYAHLRIYLVPNERYRERWGT